MDPNDRRVLGVEHRVPLATSSDAAFRTPRLPLGADGEGLQLCQTGLAGEERRGVAAGEGASGCWGCFGEASTGTESLRDAAAAGDCSVGSEPMERAWDRSDARLLERILELSPPLRTLLASIMHWFISICLSR